MSDGYDNTVSGLLRKRAELLGELSRLRKSLAAAENAIENIDRVLECLGHHEPIDDMRPSGTRDLLLRRHGIARFVLEEMRASETTTTRAIAIKIIELDGRNPLDRRLLSDVVGRVSNAIRRLRRDGVVEGYVDSAHVTHWTLTDRPSSD